MYKRQVQLYDSSVEEPDGYVLYSNGGEADTVEGAVYDKATNTITLTNYNHPEMTLATNEMGDDLKLHLVGDNHIAELVVWGFGWGGNLEITGDGSLTINENKTSQTAAIRFMAEGTPVSYTHLKRGKMYPIRFRFRRESATGLPLR